MSLHLETGRSRKTFNVQTLCGLYGCFRTVHRAEFHRWIELDSRWQARSRNKRDRTCCQRCVAGLRKEERAFRRQARAWFRRAP